MKPRKESPREEGIPLSTAQRFNLEPAEWLAAYRDRRFAGNRLRTLCGLAGIAMLAGCATAPDPNVPEPNAEIDQARQDVDQARLLGAIWLVRDPGFGDDVLSVQDMLERAIALQQSGDTRAASTIALKASRFAKLGIRQANTQQDAAPFYPN